jgi:hypothetical protein
MKSQRLMSRVVALVGIAAAPISSMAAAPPAGASVEQDAQRQVVQRLDRMPLLFVPEQVSPDGAMGYVVRGSEASIWLTSSGLSYRLTPGSHQDPETGAGSWVVALDLVGATPRAPVGEEPLPTRVSYFKGPKDQWRTGLPSYGSVRYQEPWPGVDVVLSGTAGELESTFVVRPGADPTAIRLAYRGATAVRLEPDGSLVVDTPLGEISEQAPVAYQEIDGLRVEVAAAFELDENSQPDIQAYHFRLGDYDRSRELLVDPVTLVYCGYLGGAEDDLSYAIALDGAGDTYVTGVTTSTQSTFPVTVGPDLSYNGGGDVFVAKVSGDGSFLDYCGYIGGADNDVGYGIAIDSARNAYVTGFTYSTEATFPVSIGPDLTHNGDCDVFVAKIDPTGTILLYCGYIGGTDVEGGNAIAVDNLGNAYVAGYTSSTEASFPVVIGPDLTFNGYTDAFAAKVSASGAGLDYCGYIGGSDDDQGTGIAVDFAGNAHVVGIAFSTEATFPVVIGPDLSHNGSQDAFVASVSPSGAALVYCGYIGGSSGDAGWGIAVDVAGNAYIAGNTTSTEATFPVTVGPDLTFNGGTIYGDAFVAKIDADGSELDYCGYIGGSNFDLVGGGGCIAVDAGRNAYVTGWTLSTETSFPVTVGPDLTHNGVADAFVARVAASGTALEYCGYIGGAASEAGHSIAVDNAGDAYITGSTESDEVSFPVVVGPDVSYNGGDHDGFVAKVSSPDLLFTDGFESGDTSTWSATVP